MTTLLLDLQKQNQEQEMLLTKLQDTILRYQIVHKTMIDSIHIDRFNEYARGYNDACVTLTNLVTKLISEGQSHE